MSDASSLALSISDAVKTSGLSRARLYELIAVGAVDARKAGVRTLVVTASLVAYLEGLPKTKIGAARRAAA